MKYFGSLPDGSDIHEVKIRGGGLAASIINYGAVIRQLGFETEGLSRSLVLGFDKLSDYLQHSPYFGCIVGRYANRIAQGKLVLDGTSYQLSLNEAGKTHLHGGFRGFAQRRWQIEDIAENAVLLRLVSPHGDEGYPGQVEATCLYRLSETGFFQITLEGRADRPTILNLAGHSYFNLDGGSDVLAHLLEIPATQYTPVDADLIPTGKIEAVASTPLDFRTARPIVSVKETARFTYDHNFIIADEPSATPRFSARLQGPETGIRLEVWSTEPGLQFYDGAKLNVPVPGLDGRRYGPHSGLCLEPQRFPDTPNQPHFGNAMLRPGETYRQVTEYRISQQ